MEPIVETRCAGKRYGEGATAVDALIEANLAIHAGEVLVIQGPSGSGKTTLLSILGLLLRPSSGEVLVEGRVTTGLAEKALPRIRARTFGFIFQGFNLFAALSALDNVVLATRMRQPKVRVAEIEREARKWLDAVGLGKRMQHAPADMSGGEKQRVAIARALCGGPKVILADEPTAALDSKTALGVMELLQSLACEQDRAVVVVTHDPRLERYAKRVVVVEDGRLAASRAVGDPGMVSNSKNAGRDS